MTFDLAVVVSALGFLVWAFVAYRAWRQHVDIVLLALVLIVLGLLGGPLLARFGVEASGAWAFLATGLALLVLWPKRA